MNIPLIDILTQYRSIQSEIDTAVRQVLESGQFILGPNVSGLESEVAGYLGVQHAIGVGSGTDALVLTLRALNIGQGDEVIVPTYTFFATAEAVMLTGAIPVFVDIDEHTYCLDTNQVESLITERTRAIIPVHLYGHPAEMDTLLQLARQYALKVIEDNAQAFGSEFRGRKTGSLGDVACLSFFPTKNLGGYGDGGMIVTNDADLAEHLRMLRSHGWRKKYHPEVLGYNSRLDELQAAILRVKLRHLDKWTERRRTLATHYTSRLFESGVGLPTEAPGAKHVYHLYNVRLKDRDDVQAKLKAQGISSAVYYPKPLHLLKPCIDQVGVRGSFPVAEQASREILAIPFYPEMSDQHIDRVVTALRHELVALAQTA
jgi:dTDP-4-amino-4,6-dideoxygalactose transaminase